MTEEILYGDFSEAEVTDQILSGKMGTIRYWGETKDHSAMCLKMGQKLARWQVVRVIGKWGDILLG